MNTFDPNNPPKTLPADFDFSQGSIPSSGTDTQTFDPSNPPKTLPADFDFKGGQNDGNQNDSGWIEKAGDFLFPIVGDVYHGIKGDRPKKTALQYAGDLALSALPFIPGLGQVGTGARVLGAGVKGAGMLAKGLEVARAANPIVKGMVAGYGGGVASNLSQGKGLGESVNPIDLTNILSTATGGIAPKVMGIFSKTLDKMGGLTPDIKKELISNVKPDEWKSYLSTVENRTKDLRAPTAVDLATDQFDKAAGQVEKLRREAGAAVGEAKLAVGQQPIDMVELKNVVDDFHNEVQNRYGISLVQDKKGNIILLKDPGSFRNVSPDVQNRIVKVAKQLNSLQDGSLGNASDVAANISDLVDYSKKDLYGNSNDPLEGLIKKTDGGLRATINKTSPEMAAVNEKFQKLQQLEDDIKSGAGNKLQRGSLLIRRATAGNSADAQELFDRIKDVTGMDLTKHAVLAKWATDVAGNASEKTLFEKGIEKGMGGMTLTGMLGTGANKVVEKLTNPAKRTSNMLLNANREPSYLKSAFGAKAFGTKGALETTRSLTDLFNNNQGNE